MSFPDKRPFLTREKLYDYEAMLSQSKFEPKFHYGFMLYLFLQFVQKPVSSFAK